MRSEAKQTTDMILGAAMGAAFAIPGAGAAIGAVIGIAQMFFDLFCPASGGDPNQESATSADLNAAINKIDQIIQNDLWKQDVAGIRSAVLAQSDTLATCFESMAQAKLNVVDVGKETGDSTDGGIYYTALEDPSTVKQLNDYFSPSSGANTLLTKALEELRSPTQANPADALRARCEGAELYSLTASSYIAYLKAWVLWQWGHGQVLNRQAYLAWDKLDRAYESHAGVNDQGINVYRQKHSQPIYPQDALTSEPEWNAWSANPGGPVQAMIKEVDRILHYVEGFDAADPTVGLHSNMAKAWSGRIQAISDRVSKVSVVKLPIGGYFVDDVDLKTGSTSVGVEKQAFAELQARGKVGALIAYLWASMGDEAGITNITEDKIRDFGREIEKWKLARSTVNFKTYEVKTGDLLASLAEKNYGSSLYAIHILAANLPPPPADSSTPPPQPLDANYKPIPSESLLLKLPVLENIGEKMPTHIAVGSDTLASIAAAKYGSESFSFAVAAANDQALRAYISANKNMVVQRLSGDMSFEEVLKSLAAGGGLRALSEGKPWSEVGLAVTKLVSPPPGTVLKLPDIFARYAVMADDTAATIAKRFYLTDGHGKAIADANPDLIKDENTKLEEGTVIRIPDLAAFTGLTG